MNPAQNPYGPYVLMPAPQQKIYAPYPVPYPYAAYPPYSYPPPSTCTPSYQAELHWSAPNFTRNQKVVAIARLLFRDLRMTPMDFVLATISADQEFNEFRKMFYASAAIERFLNVVKSNVKGEHKLRDWMRFKAVELVEERVYDEMENVHEHLQMKLEEVTPELLMDFDLEQYSKLFTEHTPTLRRILLAACQTKRAEAENKLKTPDTVLTTIQSQLANFRSQNNLRVAIPFGVFLLSTGAPRRLIDLLSALCLCPSYSGLHNLEIALSERQMTRAQQFVRISGSGFGQSHDNYQQTSSVHVEQRDLQPPKVQVGTTAVVFSLRNTSKDALSLKAILERRALLQIITYNDDIRPTLTQMHDFMKHARICIVEALLSGTGEQFSYAANSTELEWNSYRPPPPGYKTKYFVLHTTTLDEGSIDGTIGVNEDIYMGSKQLAFNPFDLEDRAIPSIHDQKSNSLLRAAQVLRKGDIGAIRQLLQHQLGPGFFHTELNFAWSIHRLHKGSASEIGSLQYYAALLGRTRLAGEHPDFDTLKSFYKEIFSGHVLYYYETVTGKSLTQYSTEKPSVSVLLDVAQQILDRFFLDSALNTRAAKSATDCGPRNIALLNRDLLLFYMLTSSVSSGDFGRVELMLGMLTTRFAGGGNKNYTSELLYFIQHLKKVWPEPFANIMRDNSLITTTGHSGHCYGIDKNTEFVNNFQKVYSAAKGLHSSWNKLHTISPNIPIYQHIKHQFGSFTPAAWTGTTHTDTDKTKAIQKIQFTVKQNRIDIANAALSSIDMTTGKEKRVVRAPVTRKVVDVMQKGREMLRGRTFTSWVKRYKAWAAGDQSYVEDIEAEQEGNEGVEAEV